MYYSYIGSFVLRAFLTRRARRRLGRGGAGLGTISYYLEHLIRVSLEGAREDIHLSKVAGHAFGVFAHANGLAAQTQLPVAWHVLVAAGADKAREEHAVDHLPMQALRPWQSLDRYDAAAGAVRKKAGATLGRRLYHANALQVDVIPRQAFAIIRDALFSQAQCDFRCPVRLLRHGCGLVLALAPSVLPKPPTAAVECTVHQA